MRAGQDYTSKVWLLTTSASLAMLMACGNGENNASNNTTTEDMSAMEDMSVQDQGVDDMGLDDMAEDMAEDMTPSDMEADLPPTGEARVQLLHLADGAGEVDIYVNGEILLDDFAEETGTGFFPVTAGAELTVDVVAGDALDNSDPVYTVTLADGLVADTKYVLAAMGDVNSDDEASAFRVVAIGGARTPTEVGTGPVGAMLVHAVDDAPTVDVVLEQGFSGETAVDNFAFGSYTSDAAGMAQYIDIDPAALTFGGTALVNINEATTDEFVAGFQTTDLSSLAGQQVVIAATGSLAEGTFDLTAFLGLDAATPAASPGLALSSAARLQVVHNSPDPAAEVVDVYGNGVKLIDDFAFRTATPFITVPSGTDLDLNIAAPDSEDDTTPVVDAPTINLDPGSTTIAVASGVVGAEGDAAFEILTTEGNEGLGAADPDSVLVNVLVKLHHGSPDTPAVGIRAEGADTNIVDSFEYKDFVGYVPLSSDTNTVLEVVNPVADFATVVKTDAAIDFSNFTTPVVVMASGSTGLVTDIFEAGVNLEAIALIAVLPDGTVTTLPLILP